MKSKYHICFQVIIVIILFYSPSLILQNETIQWIPLSKDAPDNIPGRTNAIITFNQIGLPVYPGVYLTSYYPADSSNGSGDAIT